MPKFTIRAYATDYYEKEIEAETEEQAKQAFQDQWENGSVTADQTDFSFEDEDEHLEYEDSADEEELEEKEEEFYVENDDEALAL